MIFTLTTADGVGQKKMICEPVVIKAILVNKFII